MRSVLIHLSLSVGGCVRGWRQGFHWDWRGEKGWATGRTFDRERWAVAAGFHQPAEEDGHVGDVDILEEFGVLDV